MFLYIASHFHSHVDVFPLPGIQSSSFAADDDGEFLYVMQRARRRTHDKRGKIAAAEEEEIPWKLIIRRDNATQES